MKGFVAVLSLVLLALVCNSGALHVPAAGVAAAQECCVRNTDNASFQQFHDRDSIRQKKDSDITGIIGEIPDVACRAGASVKGMHLRYISVETAHFLRILQRYLICRMNNLTYCCTLVHDSSRSPNWDNACAHYIFGLRRILI